MENQEMATDKSMELATSQSPSAGESATGGAVGESSLRFQCADACARVSKHILSGIGNAPVPAQRASGGSAAN